MNTLQQLQQAQAYQAKIQEMLNTRFQRNGYIDKRTLTFYAEYLLSQYPQYKDHWNDEQWEVKQVTRDIKTKMGQAFKAEDITIGYYDRYSYHTAFSFRNACDTGYM